MKPRIAAVVVAYNSAEEIGRCLGSIRGLDEVVVVDNASQDGSVAAARAARPDATVIANADNRGFAAAVNQGVRATQAELIALLNPDVELLDPLDADSAPARAALRPDVALAAGRLENADGSYQAGFGVRALPGPWTLAAEALLVNRVWPGNPLNRRWRLAGFDPDRAQDCEQPAGAFWVFRREAFEDLGGFDEGFWPLWFEDVDFCRRALDAGMRIRYEPGVRARHAGGHSLRTVSSRERQSAWYGSLLRFSAKHFSPAAALGVRTAVGAGLALRAVACRLQGGRPEESRAYLRAAARAARKPAA